MNKKVVKMLILLSLFPLLVIGAMISLFAYLYAIIVNQDEAWNIAIAIDDLGNVSFNGALGQTISSRCAHSNSSLCKFLCWILDQVNPGHCKRALTAPDQNLQVKN